MEAALEAGADDVVTNDDGSIEVITPPYEYVGIKDTLEAAGFKAEMGEVTMKPLAETEITGETWPKCRNCSTHWKAWTTCKRCTPPP